MLRSSAASTISMCSVPMSTEYDVTGTPAAKATPPSQLPPPQHRIPSSCRPFPKQLRTEAVGHEEVRSLVGKDALAVLGVNAGELVDAPLENSWVDRPDRQHSEGDSTHKVGAEVSPLAWEDVPDHHRLHKACSESSEVSPTRVIESRGKG